jgi:hypothetical protein
MLTSASPVYAQPNSVCTLSGRGNDGVALAFGNNHVWVHGAAEGLGHIGATIGAHVTGIPNFDIRIGDVAASCHGVNSE